MRSPCLSTSRLASELMRHLCVQTVARREPCSTWWLCSFARLRFDAPPGEPTFAGSTFFHRGVNWATLTPGGTERAGAVVRGRPELSRPLGSGVQTPDSQLHRL